MKSFFKEIGQWLILFSITDLVFILLTWLLRPETLKSVSLFIFLFSSLMIGVGYVLQQRIRRKMLNAFKFFIEDPSEKTKAVLIGMSNHSWNQVIDDAYIKFQQQAEEINEKQIGLQNYQEYIEAWVHEIKTPLSLMILVLENHHDEISSYAMDRLSYVRLQINQDVERILYYARLQTNHVDYNFSRFRLDKCTNEALSEYIPLAEEKNIKFTLEMQPLEVVSDRKVLLFMISQLISNAVKYASPENGNITVTITQDKDSEAKIHLIVHDNGSGVPSEDLPFIFDKGFTGNHPDRQKATGMGLYLVSKYAKALNIEVQPEAMLPNEFGFGIELVCPTILQ